MNHEQFIEKHVREELIKQGFPVPIAQGGGHSRPWIYTGVCLRQAVRGKFSMMFYDTRNCGQRNKPLLPTGSKKSALSVPNSAGCSERLKTVLVEQQRPSGAITGCNCEVSMTGQTVNFNEVRYG
ncbi:hypothetical protein [Atlantibacter hermannii]|uniref:hypothetical protein n=1 Tax=Atlantibacter hermannii TaxID=565 RepID=UPI00289DB644|nr:hypothetical protein [Atlantibacter hermannii]